MDKLKNEAIYMGILAMIAIIILKIAFYKEGIITTIKLILSFFWLFIIPGFCIAYKLKLNFLERLVIGFGISAAVIGITSYYLGLANLNLKYHHIILPTLLLIFAYFYSIKPLQKQAKQSKQ